MPSNYAVLFFGVLILAGVSAIVDDREERNSGQSPAPLPASSSQGRDVVQDYPIHYLGAGKQSNATGPDAALQKNEQMRASAPMRAMRAPSTELQDLKQLGDQYSPDASSASRSLLQETESATAAAIAAIPLQRAFLPSPGAEAPTNR